MPGGAWEEELRGDSVCIRTGQERRLLLKYLAYHKIDQKIGDNARFVVGRDGGATTAVAETCIRPVRNTSYVVLQVFARKILS